MHDTKARLAQGERIVEVLKQNQSSPIDVEKQVAIIYAVTNDLLTAVPAADIKEYEAGLFRHLDTDAAGVEVMQTIRSTGKLEAETEEKLKAVLNAYTEQFLEMNSDK